MWECETCGSNVQVVMEVLYNLNKDGEPEDSKESEVVVYICSVCNNMSKNLRHIAEWKE